ncbi:hypothetical protein [Halolamina sp. C58]|uniref:hypothetical protein n=1 Tax=Halolamina sp. C58 TaxID=3421640 RepID=UPI003EBA5200
MSDESDVEVPDDSSFGALSGAFWALTVAFGLALFFYDFGIVTIEEVVAGQPIGVIHNFRVTMSVIAMIGGGSFVAVTGWFVYRYAAAKRESAAKLSPGSGRYTFSVWSLGIAFLVLMTVFMGASALAQTDQAAQPTDQVETERVLEMDITAGQWFFRYDVAGVPFSQGNHVVLPADTVLNFELTSADVIHSFAIQELGVKKDAMPGQINSAWFYVEEVEGERTITANGTEIPVDTYQVNCAELCGKGHSQMVSQVFIVSPENYEIWVEANGGTVPESFEAGEGGDGHGEEEGGH